MKCSRACCSHQKAEGEASSPAPGQSLLCSAGNGIPMAVGMSSSPAVSMLPGAICTDRPSHSRAEKQNPAQEGLVVRRKYYLTCIVLGKENKGPGTEPGPLASFFFFSFLFFWAIVLVRTIFLVVFLLCFVFFGVFGVDNARGNFLVLFLCFGTGTARMLGHVSCGRDTTAMSNGTSTSTGPWVAPSVKQRLLDCPRAGGQEGKAKVWAER